MTRQEVQGQLKGGKTSKERPAIMQELMPPGITDLKSPVHPEKKNVTFRPCRDLQNTRTEGGGDEGEKKRNVKRVHNES
jgi:hypothetical protein